MNILVNLGLKWVEIFEVKIPDHSFIVVPRPPPFLNPHMHVSYRILCIYIYIYIFFIYIYIYIYKMDLGSGLNANTYYTMLHHLRSEPYWLWKQCFNYHGSQRFWTSENKSATHGGLLLNQHSSTFFCDLNAADCLIFTLQYHGVQKCSDVVLLSWG